MRDIRELRAELDSIDRELTALFCRRMEVAVEVADWKLARALPILDAAREEQVLESRSALAPEAQREAVRAFFTEVMRLSRAQQALRMEQEADGEATDHV